MSELYEILVPRLPEHIWILVVGVMTNVACSLLGCYLVLRRMSLLGDALSHAVLPGLVIAFIWSGSLAIGTMFVGAFAIGLVTSLLIETLQRRGNIPSDSSMGIVFTSLFALGVILIKRYAQKVHIDTDCVFQGQLGVMPFYHAEWFGYSWELFGSPVPRAFTSILPALLMNILFVTLLWKELKISSFDPALATTMGLRSSVIHYALMALVAATTVGAFEAVGSILVVAMLIVPPAAAHLLCDRLWPMVALSTVIAALSAYLGFVISLWLDVDPAGMMAVAAGVIYLLAMLFSPRYGIVSTLAGNLRTSLRILREDLLAMLYRLEELAADRRLSPDEALKAVGGGMMASVALRDLQRRQAIESKEGKLELTPSGRDNAQHLVRSHRLWETYLYKFVGLPADHVHAPAERMEHYIGPQLQSEIATDLGPTARDPHGRDIPEADASR